MQTIIKTPGPASFLALVPQLIGVQPADSLVVIPFQGKRTAGGLRVDLPGPRFKPLVSYVGSILGQMRAIDGVVVIVYCSSSSDLLPQRDLVEAMLRRLSRDGLAIKDAFCVSGDDWAPYISDSGRVAFSATWDRLDAAGLELPAQPWPLDFPPAPAKVVADVARAVAASTPVSSSDVFEEALTWTDDQFEEDRASLIAALQNPAVRDATMLQWAASPGAEVADEVIVGIGPLPDRSRLVAALSLLSRLRSVAAPHLQPPLLCMLSWLSWAMGSGSRAGEYLDACLAVEPEYGMARLLQTMQVSGQVPRWLLDRSP